MHLSPIHAASAASTPGGAGAGAGAGPGSLSVDGSIEGGGTASAHNLLLKRALVTLRCTLSLTIGECEGG